MSEPIIVYCRDRESLSNTFYDLTYHQLAGPLVTPNVYILKTTTSTMDSARYLCTSTPCIVIAERQTRGRGRSGRSWESPAGGLWTTIVLPHYLAAKGSSVVAGFAVAKVLRKLVPVTVKWPNDLVVFGKKLGGILVEVTSNQMLVGIGINYYNEPPFPGTISLSSIRTCLPPRGAVLAEIYRHLIEELYNLVRGTWTPDMELDWLFNKNVIVELENGSTLQGIGAGITSTGDLLVYSDGRLVAVSCCSVVWAEDLEYKG